jgi:predicted membrane protein
VWGGWLRFGEGPLLAQTLLSFVLAVLLGAFIAYHPRSYGKAMTLADVEQPKIYLMYSLVGALVAMIIRVAPPMALVVFGIGGLLRFRTDVGAAKDTGRIILVTCTGLCCGLGLYPVAVLGTAFGWVLIYFLEARVAYRVVIKGLGPDVLAQAATAYSKVLDDNGADILSEKKNFVKQQVAFVFRAPGVLDREELEDLFKSIDPKLHGAVDWASS